MLTDNAVAYLNVDVAVSGKYQTKVDSVLLT